MNRQYTNGITACAAVGQIVGQYYLIIVDHKKQLFWQTKLQSLALYVVVAAVKSTQSWLAELFAMRCAALTQHSSCWRPVFWCVLLLLSVMTADAHSAVNTWHNHCS